MQGLARLSPDPDAMCSNPGRGGDFCRTSTATRRPSLRMGIKKFYIDHFTHRFSSGI